MSTYNDASLVLVPSGYKTSVLFSQKPMDANGQLTFSRASNATRVAPNGLIEEVRTNACLYSEDQTNWTTQDQTSVTANAAANPLNGATTADKVIPSAVTADHYRGLTMATMVGEITASIYVKADGYDFFDWGIYNNSASNYPVRAIFDLSTQAITYINGSAASITSIGSGWYRVSITCSVASSSSIALYHRVKASTTTGTYSGNGTSGMLLWGCQLESGVMTDYIGPTTTSARSTFAGITVDGTSVPNVPRLDYLNSSCPRLLLEPQRTNIALYSEQFDNAAWAKTNSSVTANAVTSPDGYTNADLLQSSSSTEPRIRQTTTQTGSAAFTFSCFAKKGNVNFLILRNIAVNNVGGSRAWFNLNTGVVGTVNAGLTASMVSYGNGWYRCVISGTTDAVPTNLVDISLSSADNSISGSAVGSNVYIWGAQLEAGSYATSYIPTLGTSVTRLADAAYKTGIAGLIGDSAGFIFGEVSGLTNAYGTQSTILSLTDGTASTNSIQFSFNASTGYVTPRIYRAGSTIFVQDVYIGTLTNILKFVISYGAGRAVCYINGVKEKDVSGLTFFADGTLTRVGMDTGAGGSPCFGNIKQILIGTSALTDAQCIELTTL